MTADAVITIHESRLLRTTCSRNRREYSQSELSLYLFILPCPSDIHGSSHVNMLRPMAAVRDFHSKQK